MADIEKRTGKPMTDLMAIVKGSAPAQHRGMVRKLCSDLGMGHGDANLVVHFAMK